MGNDYCLLIALERGEIVAADGLAAYHNIRWYEYSFQKYGLSCLSYYIF